MNRTDRLYAMREELRRASTSGRTAERLAATFEVSGRTIKRDITALQHSGFPVRARPGPGGGYVVDPKATLPRSTSPKPRSPAWLLPWPAIAVNHSSCRHAES